MSSCVHGSSLSILVMDNLITVQFFIHSYLNNKREKSENPTFNEQNQLIYLLLMNVDANEKVILNKLINMLSIDSQISAIIDTTPFLWNKQNGHTANLPASLWSPLMLMLLVIRLLERQRRTSAHTCLFWIHRQSASTYARFRKIRSQCSCDVLFNANGKNANE